MVLPNAQKIRIPIRILFFSTTTPPISHLLSILMSVVLRHMQHGQSENKGSTTSPQSTSIIHVNKRTTTHIFENKKFHKSTTVPSVDVSDQWSRSRQHLSTEAEPYDRECCGQKIEQHLISTFCIVSRSERD